MKSAKGKVRARVGVILRAVLFMGVCCGVISAKPGNQDHMMSFSDVLNLLEEQSQRGGSGNRDASVDYLRHEGSYRVTCKSQGLCNCYSKALRRSFCCDCLQGPCFPGDSEVTTPKGQVKMADLSKGDIVLAGSDSGELVWSPVVTWLDRRPEEDAQYLAISTEGGPSLTLSSSHLLFTSKDDQLVSRFAGDVSDTESLWMVPNHSSTPSLATMENGMARVETTNITNIKPVLRKGAFVPLTQTGSIVVNGILASCYATVTHEISHFALAPLRWLPSTTAGDEQQGVGTLPYVTLLKWLAPKVLPAHHLARRDASVQVEKDLEMPGSDFVDLWHKVFHSFLISV